MGFLPVSISGVEMPLLRKCLQEMFLPSKSHDKGNTVLSFNWCCSMLGDKEENQTLTPVFLPVVLRHGSDLQKTGARHRRNSLAATRKGLDGAQRG